MISNMSSLPGDSSDCVVDEHHFVVEDGVGVVLLLPPVLESWVKVVSGQHLHHAQPF